MNELYPDETNETRQLRQACWEKRFNSFGTAKVFERRAKMYALGNDIITFLGIATPLSVGGAILAFGANADYILKFALPVAGCLSVFQLLISLWAVVSHWTNKAAAAALAVAENHRLAGKFDELANRPPKRLKMSFQSLFDEYQRQEASDTQHRVSNRELCRGMRSSLIQYGLECKICGVRPTKMERTDCSTCGKY